MLRKYSSFCLSSFSFASLVSWERMYHYKWVISEGTLVTSFVTFEDNKNHILQPIGEFPIALQDKIIQYASSLHYPLTVYGVSDSFIKHFPAFISHFDQTEFRDMDNYIYSSEDLALLNGRDYHSKRNLINQFEKKYNWTSEPIAEANVSDCFEVLHNIYNAETIESDSYLAYELKVLEFVLQHFTELEQHGVLVRIDKEPVAFSIFEMLNETTCVIHFEKAMREFKGLYQLINREAAKFIFSKGYSYINREEDLGIEGLRKAKLSYHPISLCPAYALVFKS